MSDIPTLSHRRVNFGMFVGQIHFVVYCCFRMTRLALAVLTSREAEELFLLVELSV